MSTGKRVAKNLFALFTGEAVSSGLAFLITILLARRLGDEGFGRLAFVQAMMVYFTLLTDMGLSTFGAREIARSPEKAAQLSGQIFSIRLFFAICLILLFSAGLWFYPASAEIKWLCFGSILALLTQALNPEFVFQGTERMSGIATWRILVHIFYLVLVFFLISGRSDLWSVPYYRLLAEAATLAVLALIAWRFLRSSVRWHFDRRIWKSYLKESAVMAASVVVVKLYYTFDTFMLGIMDKPEAVGWYNAAYKVVFLFIGGAGLTQMAFAPVFAKKWRDAAELDSVVKKFALLLCFLGGLATGGIILLHQEIVLFLFGATYVNSGTALVILALSMYGVFVGTVFMAPLLYTGRHKVYLVLVSLGALVNVVLNLVFIPFYSYQGAALATVISNVLIAALSGWVHQRHVNHWQSILTVTTISVLIAVSLLVAKIMVTQPWLSAAVFILSSLLVCWLIFRHEAAELWRLLR